MSETNQIPNQIKPFAFDLAVDKQKAICFIIFIKKIE